MEVEIARSEQLSPDSIRAAALDLVDEQGFAALSMRTLGARLGVKAASLYYHVPNRAALLRLIADSVAANVLEAVGDTDDWRDLFEQLAAGMRQALRNHPGATMIVATRDVSPHVYESVVPVVLTAMRTALNVTDEQALYLIQSLFVLVIGHGLAEFGDAPEPPAAPVEYYDAWFDIAVATFLDGIVARYSR
jgi:TetR/AcrR family tetracycline transcriptional repressor